MSFWGESTLRPLPSALANYKQNHIRIRLTFTGEAQIVLLMAPEPRYEPLATEKLAVDRKLFFIDLKENQRGRFLKITEDVAGRRDTIMVPIAVLPDFLEALRRLAEYEATLPPAAP